MISDIETEDSFFVSKVRRGARALKLCFASFEILGACLMQSRVRKRQHAFTPITYLFFDGDFAVVFSLFGRAFGKEGKVDVG